MHLDYVFFYWQSTLQTPPSLLTNVNNKMVIFLKAFLTIFPFRPMMSPHNCDGKRITRTLSICNEKLTQDSTHHVTIYNITEFPVLHITLKHNSLSEDVVHGPHLHHHHHLLSVVLGPHRGTARSHPANAASLVSWSSCCCAAGSWSPGRAPRGWRGRWRSSAAAPRATSWWPGRGWWRRADSGPGAGGGCCHHCRWGWPGGGRTGTGCPRKLCPWIAGWEDSAEDMEEEGGGDGASQEALPGLWVSIEFEWRLRYL